MKLNYLLDTREDSSGFSNTPNSTAKRLPFYIGAHGHFYCQSGYFTERQGQKDYLLIYTVSGLGHLHCREQDFTLMANQATVIDCLPYHVYRTDPTDLWNFRWIHFNGTAAREYYRLLNDGSQNLIRIQNPTLLENLLDSLIDLFSINDILSSTQISMQMTAVLSQLITSKFSTSNSKKYEEHRQDITKVIAYIQQHYQRKISLDELVSIAYLSKYYFLRVFKSQIGTSPYEYLINYRITKAKELLKSTHLSVGEIADAVGFGDCSNFIREFRNVVGVTPVYYRNSAML